MMWLCVYKNDLSFNQNMIIMFLIESKMYYNMSA